MRSTLLMIDAAINLALGFLLLIFPLDLFQFLGLPLEVPSFYASILGGVLVGLGIALLIERLRGPENEIQRPSDFGVVSESVSAGGVHHSVSLIAHRRGEAGGSGKSDGHQKRSGTDSHSCC